MSNFSKLPPLNALRGFEAVARHMSFSGAAQELRITSAAVSQQIKNLEDFLGVQVFSRQGRRIQITEAGRQILPGVEKGFSNLADAVRPYLNSVSANYLSCSTVGAFGKPEAIWKRDRSQKRPETRERSKIKCNASLK